MYWNYRHKTLDALAVVTNNSILRTDVCLLLLLLPCQISEHFASYFAENHYYFSGISICQLFKSSLLFMSLSLTYSLMLCFVSLLFMSLSLTYSLMLCFVSLQAVLDRQEDQQDQGVVPEGREDRARPGRHLGLLLQI